MSDSTIFSGVHEVVVELPTAPTEAPGLVLKWRRRGDMWEGLVSREVDGRVVTEWIPAVMLLPAALADSGAEAEGDPMPEHTD